LECGGKRSATPLWISSPNPKRRRRFALPAHSKVEIVFKDGVGYDSDKLIQSVQGLVGILKFGVRRPVAAFESADKSAHSKVEIVFKDGVGYDSDKLIQSVQGLVGIR
jgi:hypothetical protein